MNPARPTSAAAPAPVSHSASSGPPALTPRIIVDDSCNPPRKYSLGKQLGKGGFARVYELLDLTNGELTACKVIAKAALTKPKAKAKLFTEIKIHNALTHKHIVRFLKHFEDAEHVYILLELCSNQTLMELNKRRKRLTEPETRYIMSQILSGVEYMHKNRAIHRDLKLGNLFLDSYLNIKIGDFGLAAQLDYDGERKTTICGTPNYIAPEILDGGKVGHSYEVDVWSLGVILYTLLIGKPPFETADVKTTYRKIRSNSYTFPEGVHISHEARDLIKRILVPNPAARPTVSQIRADVFFSCGAFPTSLPLSCLHTPYVVNENENHAQNVATAPVAKFESTSGSIPSYGAHPVPGSTATFRLPLRSVTSNQVLAQPTSQGLLTSRPSSQSSNAMSALRMPMTSRPSTTSSTARPLVPSASDKLDNIFAAAKTSSSAPFQASPGVQGAVWILQWADFSSKYGLAFLMSNGMVGGHFNDSTKMLLRNDATGTVDYFDRKRSTQGAYDEHEQHSLESYPENLRKKVTLIKYFKRHFESHCVSPSNAEGSSSPSKNCLVAPTTPQQQALRKLSGLAMLPGPTPTFAEQFPTPSMVNHVEDLVYVKRWIKTDQAITVRMSNKSVQMNFFDGTHILLASESKAVNVTVVEPSGAVSNQPLTSAFVDGRPDFARKLRHMREVLHQLSNPAGVGAPVAATSIPQMVVAGV
eukprot:ANDGO_02142.mRNA.1 putative serine/threonine-protein kinase CCRP1